MRNVSVYINKERHIVVTPDELPVSMSDPWPVVKVFCHRYRGVMNMREAARNYEFGIGDDCEEVMLTRQIVAIPDGADERYAATWAFRHLDELGG